MFKYVLSNNPVTICELSDCARTHTHTIGVKWPRTYVTLYIHFFYYHKSYLQSVLVECSPRILGRRANKLTFFTSSHPLTALDACVCYAQKKNDKIFTTLVDVFLDKCFFIFYHHFPQLECWIKHIFGL